MSNVNIKINGKDITVPMGSTILEAARAAGYDVPTLCDAEGLKPFTSCFVCAVKVEGGRGNLVPSCATKVRDGMAVTVESEEVDSARKMCITLMVSDHCGDCLPPCQTACPAEVNIRDFLALITEEKYEEANQLIKEKTPLPGSLGRVCPCPCEDVCVRTRVEKPISICKMKRFTTDMEIKKYGKIVTIPEPAAATGKKIAIIGAGPGGMSCAYYLRQKGHNVVVFEKHKKTGGMLRYGIPFYRLPDEALTLEMDAIENTGITIKCGVEIGKDISVKTLEKDYDALVIAIGAQGSSSMRIDGENLEGVYAGIDYLGKIAEGDTPDIGKKVLVVGGGNTAMDAARSAIRGGSDVTVLYRRTKKEMPANYYEIDEAEEEGVEFSYLAAPVSVSRKDGKVLVKCIKMAQGEPDASGRRSPVPIEGSEYEIEADSIISAIGQRVLPDCVKELGIDIAKNGTITADPNSFMTSRRGIFALGDCQTGADIAVRAVGNGRRTACAVDQFITGKEIKGEEKLFNSQMGSLDELPESMFEGRETKARIEMPLIDHKERITTFKEVEKGFEVDNAIEEAKRCLKCGCDKTEECKLREYATRYDVDQNMFKGDRRTFSKDISRNDIKLEPGKCITCASCVRACAEIKGFNVFAYENRGFKTLMSVPFGHSLVDTKCDGCGECVKVCPTGAIMKR